MFSSTNTRSSILALPLLTVAAVVTTVLLAGIPTSSSEEWWSSIYHIHIINQLSDDKVLKVNCNSSDNENLGGDKYVNHGEGIQWWFTMDYIFPLTWQCRLAPDQRRRVTFNAYEKGIRDFDHHVYWAINEDGVYFRNPDGRHFDIYDYGWEWIAKYD
ncbi:S-protein homolog 8 [Linum perenne]